MPSTIPYDPSLVIANVVDPVLLKNISNIAAARSRSDAAQERLNSLISMRRSFDMTKMELLNLGIATKDLEDQTKSLSDEILDAAKDYATQKIDTENVIRDYRKNILTVHANVESPVDYVKTQFKELPLAADSLNMDVQYFSIDKNDQDADSFASAIRGYVAAATSYMGVAVSTQMSEATAKNVSQQMARHDIEGTLVVTVNCTHKNAVVLAPFALNVDKGIKVWNRLFDDKINVNNPADVQKIYAQENTQDEKSFSIISGMTFGSSFVGMVHVLNTTDTTVSDKMSSVAGTLQAQMDAGAWFEGTSGGFGVSRTFGDDVKNLLSTQNITSHVTCISMGVIPSIVANDVQLAVQQFANFDPKSTMDAIATLANATSSSQESVKSSADSARMGAQLVAMKGAAIQSTLSALQPLQDGSNKMLDINSMMTALQDFLTKAANGTAGVPINYYLKDITKAMLAEAWVAKYLPGKYLTISNDDVTVGGPKQIAGTGGEIPANVDGTQGTPAG